MEKSRIVVLDVLNYKQNRNYLLYDKIKKEFIICSYYEEEGDLVTWQWGHYYNNLRTASNDFYKEEFNETYHLSFNLDILQNLLFNNTLEDNEIIALNDIIQLIKHINSNNEV